jgi:hypothetical protein
MIRLIESKILDREVAQPRGREGGFASLCTQKFTSAILDVNYGAKQGEESHIF